MYCGSHGASHVEAVPAACTPAVLEGFQQHVLLLVLQQAEVKHVQHSLSWASLLLLMARWPCNCCLELLAGGTWQDSMHASAGCARPLRQNYEHRRM